MVKQKTTAFCLALLLAAAGPALAQKRGSRSGAASAKPALKFLDAIQVASIGDAPAANRIEVVQPPVSTAYSSTIVIVPEDVNSIENASQLQLKYAVLLDADVEKILDTALFSVIDDWYGTRYVLGGSTKEGIDCSAFVQALYSKLFQIPMPRTAKEQYNATRPVSRTEMQEGDLLFFHTRGSGVSHVGMYLQNNKFVHAATSGGVMISDVYDEYWQKHFVGVGRYPQTNAMPEALKP